ncbi:hypothetical protein CASFOL_027709 [Castilleja foliolosa]|uniref:Cyclin-like domain-containing protein n=1 Tax=Castilleja foliolosa TaxID=1961234 RepID=A0ABD3CFL5_9LAMI
MMDSLLCTEVWLMSPKCNELDNNNNNNVQEYYGDEYVNLTKEDCDEALSNYLKKEAKFMPQLGYLEFVKTNDMILNARFQAVHWLIKSQTRMNLSPETVFLAVNYMDRFISLTRCQDWKYWMFELLSVACLTIAAKFNETTSWPLHEFQVEGVDNCFSPTLIEKMELTVLKALGWRMDSTTQFSYVHILTQTLNKTLIEDLTNHVIELLLSALLDPAFLEFRQCVLAMAAVRCVYEASTNIVSLDALIPQDQKDNLVKCQRIMEQLMTRENDRSKLDRRENYWHGPSSPITVLKAEWFNFYNCSVDISFLQTPKIKIDFRSDRKRKGGELGCGI